MENVTERKRVLIVDDVELNRVILGDILSGAFDVVQAESGKQALEILAGKDSNICAVLLDIIMPEMDGFATLKAMKKYGYMEYIPVIIISSEATVKSIDKAYEMGASDFINKPYNPNVVLHRVLNNIKLFNRQQTLIKIVADQVYEQHRYADMMINILSSVMEIKNGESGLHILHINTITRILAENLLQITDKYTYSKSDIQLISVASSLHDIGKMAIPDEIINKPGKLTPEEYAIMKTHSEQGAKMLEGLEEYKDERLIKYAHDICLYHHERYDGKGYPVGLVGEEIPIWAQIVSVADVFDALISPRVYKAAYSPDKAIQMITGGECGVFNPLIIECLLKSTKQILAALSRMSSYDKWEEKVKHVADDVEKYHVSGFTELTLKKFNQETSKHKFLSRHADGLVFDLSLENNEMLVHANPSLGLEQDLVFNPFDREEASKYVYMPAYDIALEYLHSVKPSAPEIYFECENKEKPGVIYQVNMLCVYADDGETCQSITGKIKTVNKGEQN